MLLCLSPAYADEGDISISTIGDLDDAIANATDGETWVLNANIETNHKLIIDKNIILDGNGHSITAVGFSPTFLENEDRLERQLLSIQSTGGTPTLKDITLVAGPGNSHVLNVYETNLILEGNITLDHSLAEDGAPLVVHGNNATGFVTTTVNGDVTLKIGANSWYGANVDNDGELKFADGSSFRLSAPSEKGLIYVDNKVDHKGKVTDSDKASIYYVKDDTKTIMIGDEEVTKGYFWDLFELSLSSSHTIKTAATNYTIVVAGDELKFIPEATGGAPGEYVYKWYKNDIEEPANFIPTDTKDLIFESASGSGDNFIVVVTDTKGNTVQDKVGYNLASKLTFEKEPSEYAIPPGTVGTQDTSVTLATTGGTGTKTYDIVTTDVDWINIDDSGLITVTRPADPVTSPTDVTFKVTDSGDADVIDEEDDTNVISKGFKQTADITITVGAVYNDFDIDVTSVPADSTVTDGGSITFTVSTSDGGSGLFSYQWQVYDDDEADFVNLIGETGSELTLDGVDSSYDGNQYKVIVTDQNVPTLTKTKIVTLTVTAPLSVSLDKTTEDLKVGEDLIILATPANGVAPYEYAWTKADDATFTQSGATLTITSVAVEDAGTYTVTVTDDEGETDTASVVVTVTAPLSVSLDKTTEDLKVGEDLIILATPANGVAPYEYAWTKEGDSTFTQTGATLSITGVAVEDAGTYTVTVTDAESETATASVVVTVNPVLSVSLDPESVVVNVGDDVTVAAMAAGGAGTYTYSWTKEGDSTFTQSGETLTLDDAQEEDSGTYTVSVTDGTDTVTADVVVIVTESLPGALAVTISPDYVKAEQGKSVTFTASAIGGEGEHIYVWSFRAVGETEFEPLGNAGETFVIDPIELAHEGEYRVAVTAGTVTKDATAELIVVSEGEVTVITNEIENLLEADDVSVEDVQDLLEMIDSTLTPDILRDHKDIVENLEKLVRKALDEDDPLYDFEDKSGLSVEIIGVGVYALEAEDVKLACAMAELPEGAPADAIAFSMDLLVDGDTVSDLMVPFFITMEIPDAFKGKTDFVIYHYMNDETMEIITPTIVGNTMSFAVTKFSTFALTGGSTPSKGGGGSGTGAAKVVDGNNTTYVPPVIDDGDNDGDGSGTGDAKPGNNTTNTTPKPTTPKDEGSSSSLMWILIVGAIIVIAAVAFFLYKRNK